MARSPTGSQAAGNLRVSYHLLSYPNISSFKLSAHPLARLTELVKSGALTSKAKILVGWTKKPPGSAESRCGYGFILDFCFFWNAGGVTFMGGECLSGFSPFSFCDL